jgi:hypothetical protein
MKIPKMGNRDWARQAYSLPEVILAALVLAILVVSLFGAFSSGLALVQLQRENLRATQILMQKMETIRLLTWAQGTNAAIANPVFTDTYDPAGTNTQHSVGVTYYGFVSNGVPDNLPADYQANMRVVTVTLYWTNYPYGGRGTKITRTRQMQTFVARNGMQNYVSQ